MFKRMAEAAQTSEVKALLTILVESESDIAGKIRHMMVTGVLDEIEQLGDMADNSSTPDATPFDPTREDSDPRIFVCNKTLKEGVSAYTLYLQMATRAKSEVVSRVFEYLAYLKERQIAQMRRICISY
jgi:hypothetical protein